MHFNWPREGPPLSDVGVPGFWVAALSGFMFLGFRGRNLGFKGIDLVITLNPKPLNPKA